MVRKYQVWFSAGLAAVTVGLTILLSVPAATQGSQEIAAGSAGPSGTSFSALGLPVGGLAILVLLIGSRVLRAAARR